MDAPRSPLTGSKDIRPNFSAFCTKVVPIVQRFFNVKIMAEIGDVYTELLDTDESGILGCLRKFEDLTSLLDPELTGHLVRETLRKVDEVGRFRGHEFILVLPETDPEQGFIGLNRIREKLHIVADAVNGQTTKKVIKATPHPNIAAPTSLVAGQIRHTNVATNAKTIIIVTA